jgi:uncharacterized protein YdiU (UPF0061 family)
MKTLEQLNFDNQFAKLGTEFYTKLSPTPLQGVRFATASNSAAALLDLHPEQLRREDFTRHFSGQQPHPKFDPLAMVYSGHQFGGYSPQLGDGRGILLGEVINTKGERWDIHLKGAGKTPYSRFGDGRAVLRSCIREYLGSEALHHLGIPTSRALCIFNSDEPVKRESIEKGAALIRLSPSHIRFGHFEYFYYNNMPDHVKLLADHVIQLHYSNLEQADNPYLALFQIVVKTTAQMIAKWQAQGFAHGVMNTDNMSILGITFDYGPYGFMEDFNPGYICNHSDHGGRYAFHQQPGIAMWNLNALAQTFVHLVPQQHLIETLKTYQTHLLDSYNQLMFEKLGILHPTEQDQDILTSLIELLSNNHPDYSIFFRTLSDYTPGQKPDSVVDLFIDRDSARQWLARYDKRIEQQSGTELNRQLQMKTINPKYILKNYLVQQAIEKAETGDFTEVEKLLNILQQPFAEQPEHERYADFTPDWGKQLEISCSS